MPPVSQQKGDKTFANYSKIDLTFNYHIFKLKDTVGCQPRFKESSSPDSVMLRHTFQAFCRIPAAGCVQSSQVLMPPAMRPDSIRQW